MSDQWTPSTEQVRRGYATDPESEYRDPIGYPAYEKELGRAFNRWLAEVRATALEEAADEFAARLPDGTGNGRAYNSHQVARMLCARAERIREEGRA